MIHSSQIFTSAFVVGGGLGGPVNATKVYTMYLYLTGFGESHIGYASALAWVFLVAMGIVTLVLFRTGRFWVHYEDAEAAR